ncbi:MAG TPA: hypothetical protein VMZ74_15605 [Ramlibacter sp.]|nr:hypothetical protein [Ramlibacter sp.]
MAITHNDRERQHRARLAQIDAVQVVAGSGDAARINHERTLIERARMFAEELSSHDATERGLEALDRLLRAVEEGSSPQVRDIGHFIEAVWNNKPLALTTLRAVDKRTADDMLDVLDAWRFARVNLTECVKGGARRISLVLRTCRA